MSLSLGEAVLEFDDAKLGEIADTTRRWYGSHLKALTRYLGEDRPVDSVTVSDLRKWRRYLFEPRTKYGERRPGVEGRYSDKTIAGQIAACKAFFNWLESEGEVESSPARALKPLKRKREDPKPISEADYLRILEAARRHSAREFAIIMFLADTGCRLQGIATLKLKNIRLDKENMRGHAIVTEKGDKARRVYFREATYKAITAYLMVRPDGYDTLFIGTAGPLTAAGIYQAIRRLAKRAGITGRCNPHSFRHRYARTASQSGIPLNVLSTMLGHEDTAITARYYAIFAEDELERWHQKADPATPQINSDDNTID